MNKYIYLLISLSLPLSLPAQTIKDYIDNDWPDARYEVHGDGTVTDKVTSLMWLQCSLGQTYADNTCSDANDATEHNWQDALEAAEGSDFASHTDWRLPNIKELSSLVARDRHEPTINIEAFPNTSSSFYWSSSPSAGDENKVWKLNFSEGYNLGSVRTETYYVRLVRSSQ